MAAPPAAPADDSAAILRSFYESALHLMGVVEVAGDDRDVLHVYDNPASEAFFAQPPGATAGRWASTMGAPAEVLQLWIGHYRASQRERRPVRFESPHPSPAGLLWLSVTVAFIGIAGSGRARFSYVAEDVTERKRAEHQRLESEQRLALALRAAQLGFFDLDLRTGHAHYGGHWAAMLGRRLEDVPATQQAWRELVHPDDFERVMAESADHLAGRTGTFHLEHRLRHADGSWRWVLSTGEVVERDAQGRALRVLGIHADISRMKETEDALREADRRKDEFLAVLAHELRNPLAPVRTAVEVLRRCDLPETPARAARDAIDRQVRHMVRLIDDLLDVSRITHGKLKLQRGPVVLQEVVQMALEVAQPTIAEAGHRLHVDLPPTPITLEADAVRLSQVLLNLLNNAARYTPRGGAIRLAVAAQEGHARMEVADTGIGFAPQDAQRLFHMFAQLGPAGGVQRGGLGIGLALARAIVQLHGGEIAAHSDGPGHGATFRVTLPLAAPSRNAPPAAAVAAAPSPAGGAPLRVLVADDNQDAADTLATLLALDGHDVRAVTQGRRAAVEVLAWQPHLVLLDIGMPDMDGHAVCRAIRAATPALRPVVVAVTGWGQPQDRARTAQAGFDGHLTKPLEAAALAPWLARAAQLAAVTP